MSVLFSSSVYSQNSSPLPTGNVGIGVSSPSSPFVVSCFSNTFSSGTSPLIDVFGVGNSPNAPLRDLLHIKSILGVFGPVRTEFVVQNNGNVGVGVTTPLEKLDIAGNIKLNNNIIYLRGNYDYNHGLRWCSSSAPFTSISNIANTDGPVLFGWGGGILGTTAGGQKAALRWNSNQQVVIGDKAPNGVYATTYRLAVDGDIVAKRVVVQTNSWADKVFDKNYKLQPLSEVEAFVKENCHLPLIPTENEVIENGIDVSRMNKLLLQKIEELTLYMIDLKKENEGIKALLSNPKK